MSFPSELSQHTELLLLTSLAEKSPESPRVVRCLDQLNRWLADQNHSEGFWEVSGYAGGNKPMASLVSKWRLAVGSFLWLSLFSPSLFR